MSVNLLPKYRVIAIIVAVGLAFSALAWSDDNHLRPPSTQGLDSIPTHPRPPKKAPKRKKHAEEGRVARELDLRLDVDDVEAMPELRELDAPDDLVNDMDISIDLESLNDLNAQFGPPPIPDRIDLDALDELKDMVIEEEDLQTLKDLNIDEEIWNKLKALKEQMDDLRSELEEDQAKRVISDYRLRREAEAIMEAVRAEIPMVRREVQKALQEYSDTNKWQ